MFRQLSLQFQILFAYLAIGFSSLVTKFFEYISKFMYLYLMDDVKKTLFRNQVARRIRELKSIESKDLLGEDPNREMSLAKMKVVEFYTWLCQNQ